MSEQTTCHLGLAHCHRAEAAEAEVQRLNADWEDAVLRGKSLLRQLLDAQASVSRLSDALAERDRTIESAVKALRGETDECERCACGLLPDRGWPIWSQGMVVGRYDGIHTSVRCCLEQTISESRLEQGALLARIEQVLAEYFHQHSLIPNYDDGRDVLVVGVVRQTLQGESDE